MDALTDRKSPAPMMSGSMIEPAKLSLSFTTAADKSKIRHVLRPENRRGFDPDGFVIPRDAQIIDTAIENGDVVFVQDEAERVHALNFAYRYGSRHSFTEVGTVLRRMRGLGHVVVAAQALWQQFQSAHDHAVVAKVSPQNDKALTFFGAHLQWREVDDSNRHALYSVASASDSTASPPHRIWFEAREDAARAHHAVLRSVRDNGLHTASGRVVPVEICQP